MSLNPSQIEDKFFTTALSKGWADQAYSDSKRAQFQELHGTAREEALRKMALVVTSVSSNPAFARKVYHETVGLIQDRALDGMLTEEERDRRLHTEE